MGNYCYPLSIFLIGFLITGVLAADDQRRFNWEICGMNFIWRGEDSPPLRDPHIFKIFATYIAEEIVDLPFHYIHEVEILKMIMVGPDRVRIAGDNGYVLHRLIHDGEDFTTRIDVTGDIVNKSRDSWQLHKLALWIANVVEHTKARGHAI